MLQKKKKGEGWEHVSLGSSEMGKANQHVLTEPV